MFYSDSGGGSIFIVRYSNLICDLSKFHSGGNFVFIVTLLVVASHTHTVIVLLE